MPLVGTNENARTAPHDGQNRNFIRRALPDPSSKINERKAVTAEVDSISSARLKQTPRFTLHTAASYRPLRNGFCRTHAARCTGPPTPEQAFAEGALELSAMHVQVHEWGPRLRADTAVALTASFTETDSAAMRRAEVPGQSPNANKRLLCTRAASFL